MKKLLSILALSVAATVGYSQGLVVFNNANTAYLVSTNNVGYNLVGGGIGAAVGRVTAGGSSGAPFGYYYALLYQTAATTPASISSSTVGSWTFGALGTNYLSAGSVNAGSVGLAGSTAGATYYIQLVGWSANEGTTWGTVSQEFASGNWANVGYFGVSNVGSVKTGGDGTPANPAAVIFSANGISSGFNLNYVVPTPEPTTIVLAGLGGLSLLAFRRKKA